MRLLLGVAAVFGLAAGAAAEEKAGGKATVTVVGKFTADKDSTLNYTLRKGDKVVAEGKGVTELPGKGVEVDAAGVEGPYELHLTAAGGVVKVTEIGVTATADGKAWKGTWGGTAFELNKKEPFGTLRGVRFPLTLSAEAKKPDGTKNKTDDEPKKLPDLKKTDTTKKPVEKKPDVKEPDEVKKPAEPKKSDAPPLPRAPAPRDK